MALVLGWVAVWLGGCVMGPELVGGVTAAPADLEPGYYWAEYAEPELALYEMPRVRGESGQWTIYENDPPEWYSGPSLYWLAEDGTWQRESEADDQTLDDWLQGWDPAPAIPDMGGG